MTEEEKAIDTLFYFKMHFAKSDICREHFDIAIKALKQQSFEGKTNGDVIRALFPSISIVNIFGGDIWFKVDNSYLRCSESWWNSPYKESDKNE